MRLLLAVVSLLAACTDGPVGMDSAAVAGDLGVDAHRVGEARMDVSGEARRDVTSVPDAPPVVHPDSAIAPTSIGSMQYKYYQNGMPYIGQNGGPAMTCACVIQRSASVGAISVACASPLPPANEQCAPQKGAGWGIWFPGLPVTSGAVKFTQGLAVAKLWGAWGNQAGNPVPFSGDYAILVESPYHPTSGLIAVAAGKLSLTAQVMLRSQAHPDKAVAVNVTLTDAPVTDVP